MKNKGFTLIELLAVIIILAIILIVAMPIMGNITNNARKQAFEKNSNTLASTASMEYRVNRYKEEKEYNIENGSFSGDSIDIKGDLPKTAKICVNKKGLVKMYSVSKNKKWCAKKDYNDDKVSIYSTKNIDCTISCN